MSVYCGVAHRIFGRIDGWKSGRSDFETSGATSVDGFWISLMTWSTSKGSSSGDWWGTQNRSKMTKQAELTTARIQSSHLIQIRWHLTLSDCRVEQGQMHLPSLV
eukprot:TRINITY_DN6546_c0_g1_i13.p3 TRINITY_DN6546_c0_g1~~TRINITY_DN6546_c0_g1_i13.p3  ORF type:complete len:105 (-),score=19.93 TRINITY_DN6546_c0_g1_i13:957-1271(-)